MNENIKKIIKIIIALIWWIGAIPYGVKKEYLFAALFVVMGIVFLVNAL